MSGPALKKLHSHSSIHESAITEAEELTELIRSCYENSDHEKDLDVAYILVEHWETRTLRHAESEEEGLYRELEEQNPDLRDTIIALKRDHQLLRNLVSDIKETLSKEGVTGEVVKKFESLIIVDLLHNRDEEKMLEK
jgi:hypothetical protein